MTTPEEARAAAVEAELRGENVTHFPGRKAGEPLGDDAGKGYTNGASKGDDAKPLPFKMLDDLKLSTAPFWLIDGYLVRSPMMMIYGPAGCGKTYLGVSVAIGMLLSQWFGRAAELGAVLICAFERHDDSEDRLAALRDRHAMTGKGLPLALVDMTGQCLDAEAEARIIATAKALTAQAAQPVRAILIDTVAAACGGREQTPGLQGELRDAGNRIAAATGALVCWIQHEGKTSHNGPIGYLDLANSCSTWWRVEEREDGSRVIHVDKANRGPVHVPLFAFRLVPFTAGQDDNGKDIVLCDVEEVALDGALASEPRQRFGKPKSDKPAAGQGPLQKLLMAELHKLARKHPDGVSRDLLKSHFVLKLAEQRAAKGAESLKPKLLTQRFLQTLETLIRPVGGDPAIYVDDADLLLPADG